MTDPWAVKNLDHVVITEHRTVGSVQLMLRVSTYTLPFNIMAFYIAYIKYTYYLYYPPLQHLIKMCDTVSVAHGV